MSAASTVVSIGPLCTGAQTLKDMGLRQAAYPFDWIFSDLAMVQHCVETRFAKLLDPALISSRTSDTGTGKSTNSWYEDAQNNPVFNHHDLTDPETLASFRRRAERFMDLYASRDGAVLLYMAKQPDWLASRDRLRLTQFCAFVASTSPASLVLVIVLCKTGEYRHAVQRVAPNCMLAEVHFGDHDNLAAVRMVLDEACAAS